MSADAAGPVTVALAPDVWGERLACAYREIGARVMHDLPIYHDALTVEAVGFTRFHGLTIGIVITPWFMNVVAPAAQGAAGSSVEVVLPAGSFAFTIGDVADVGRIASCSLFSPMFQFEDMEAARAAAEAAMTALMTPPGDDASSASAQAGSVIDRRSFLRGTLSESRT